VVVPFLNDAPDLTAARDAVLWRDFLGPVEVPPPS
jgi:hypothetical protein